MTHLTYETLLNYLENRLAGDERSQVVAHVAECPECRRRWARLQIVLQVAMEDQTITPPSEILKRAVDISHTRPETSQHKPWRRVVAALRFDSRLQFSAATVRGAARGQQLLFTTERVDIDLQIKSGPMESDLMGQILSAESSSEVLSAFVSLQNSAGTVLRATETDSLGQFTFRQIAYGIYDLVFDLGDQEVAIAGLELRNE